MGKMIEKYNFQSTLNGKCFSEQEDSPYEGHITKTLKTLRDNDFGNEMARKELVRHICTLHDSHDPRARLALKKIGNLFTEIGDELINYSTEEEK